MGENLHNSPSLLPMSLYCRTSWLVVPTTPNACHAGEHLCVNSNFRTLGRREGERESEMKEGRREGERKLRKREEGRLEIERGEEGELETGVTE